MKFRGWIRTAKYDGPLAETDRRVVGDVGGYDFYRVDAKYRPILSFFPRRGQLPLDCTQMKTRVFQSEQWLPRDVKEVFTFFSDARNLDLITPPWLNFQVLTPGPIEMKPGALIDYRLKVRWIPLSWRTEILEWEPPRRFVDLQVRGPYKLWRHEHTFDPGEGGTWIRDRVEYAVPGWILEPMVHCMFVGPDIRKIFEYRKKKIEEIFAAEPQRSDSKKPRA